MASAAREFKSNIYTQFARIGKAFANPVRLELMDLLAQTERSVEELANLSSQSMANTSRHLQILHAAQMVRARKDKKFVFYKLANNCVWELWHTMQMLGELQLSEITQARERFFDEKEAVTKINRADLLKRIHTGKVMVLDVRPTEEFLAGHIKGAVSLPLNELRVKIQDLPKGVEIVAYCRGPYCVLSNEAVRILNANGYSASRLPDGIHEWKKHRLPVEPGPGKK
jgi:rhodanese-related sulfurtransferase